MEAIIGVAVLWAVACASNRIYGRTHSSGEYRQGRAVEPDAPRAFRVVYAWVRYSTLLFGTGALLGDHPIWLAVAPGRVAFSAGLVLTLGGFALFWAAKRALGRHYSPCYDAHLPTDVVQHGPYRRIRHPIYTANLAVLAGLTIATGSLWLAINTALIGGFYARSAVREERVLAAALPAYADYLRGTGRFLPSLR